MDFEVLKKSHLKRNIIIGVIAVLIISAVILNFTRAKYRTTQSIPLVNGTINYMPYDFKMVAMYQESDLGEYESIDQVPTSGFILNTEESYCEVNGEKDSKIEIEYINGQINFLGMTTKGTKCYLYFDKISGMTISKILANKTISSRTNFSVPLTEDTTGIIYQAEDDDGITYYFAGNPTDNWIQFAGFYWRIIRINGDGTIRIIYQGSRANTTGQETQIGESLFNSTDDRNNAYVGFKYSIGEVYGISTSSTIKIMLDDWYSNNLVDYISLIDENAGFCGDRTPSTSNTTSNGQGGTGTTYTYYGALLRLYNGYSSANASPTFKCANENDLYTVLKSNKGNRALAFPIGLITADEMAFAGGVNDKVNTNYYLYTGEFYWTMSPAAYTGGYSEMFIVKANYINTNGYTYQSRGVRPVINLRADVTISSGDGTATNPYVIAT